MDKWVSRGERRNEGTPPPTPPQRGGEKSPSPSQGKHLTESPSPSQGEHHTKSPSPSQGEVRWGSIVGASPDGKRTARRARGFAMLTVLAILTLLIIFATAFIQTVRIELRTTENYKNSMVVGDVAKTGIESLRGEFSSQLYGRDGIPFTGDEIRPYVSLMDAWAIGKAEVIDPALPRTVYDVRPWLFNTEGLAANNIMLIHNGAVWEAANGLAFIAKQGVDEDPPGDISGDREPGLEGMDDNLDGRFDQDPELPAYARDRNDDDEDGLVDEDGYDFRAAVLRESIDKGRVDNMLLGLDQDGDYTGIESSAGRVNVAIAGNLNANGRHTYHQGIHPSELDLETFMVCMVGTRFGLQMAQNLILQRSGPDLGPGNRWTWNRWG